MRPRQHAAEQGVAKKRKRHCAGQQRNIIQLPSQRRADEDADQQKLGKQRDRHVNPVHRREIEFPMLLPRGVHRGNFPRQIAFDDAVGMGQIVVGAFAGRNENQLLGGGFYGGLRLGDGIGEKRVPRNVFHLVAKAVEWPS